MLNNQAVAKEPQSNFAFWLSVLILALGSDILYLIAFYDFATIPITICAFFSGLPISIQCPDPSMVTIGNALQFTPPVCYNNGNFASTVTCSPSSGFSPTNDIDITCTCDSYQAYSCSFLVTVTGKF